MPVNGAENLLARVLWREGAHFRHCKPDLADVNIKVKVKVKVNVEAVGLQKATKAKRAKDQIYAMT